MSKIWVLKEPAEDAYICCRALEPSRPSLPSLSHVHERNDARNRLGNAPSCSRGEQDSWDLQAPPRGTATCQPPARSAGQRRKPRMSTEKGKSSDQIVYGILWRREPRIAQLIQRKL